MIIEIFGIIAGIASIFGIPLTIYFSRKSENNKYDEVRKDIIQVLSYQIGDGAKLDVFEIKAIIESKLREKKLEPGKIRIQEIIEDLISNITSNPFLDRHQKKLYKDNLKRISLNIKFRNALIQASERKELLSGEKPLTESDKTKEFIKIEAFSNFSEQEEDEYFKTHELRYLSNDTYINKESRKNKAYFSFATIFSLLGSIASIIAFFFTFNSLDNKVLLYLALSITLGIIITAISNLLVKSKRRDKFENNDDEIIKLYEKDEE